MALTIIAAYIAVAFLIQVLSVMRFAKLPAVILIGEHWISRGYRLTWKDMFIIALLSMIPLHLLATPSGIGDAALASPGVFTLSVMVESLQVMGGLWVGRFLSAWRRKP